MPLLDYQGVRPWAKAIKAAVLAGKMPPWPADRRYGKFSNDPALGAGEVATLVDWVNHGAERGDPKDAPPPIAWPDSDAWSIPPDRVITLPESPPIPASGVIEIMHVAIPSGFTKDTWISSIEIHPGNRSVVHHVLFEIEPQDSDTVYGRWDLAEHKRDAAGAQLERIGKKDRLRDFTGVEAVWLPGAAPADYRIYKAAKLVPAGSDFIIQMHYTASGTATRDRTRIGLTFAKSPPAYRFLTLNPTSLRDAAHFRIPAGDPDWKTGTEIEFHQNARIAWLLPHMHLRGKDMTYHLREPDGSDRILLSVQWNFDWQLDYIPAEPIAVHKGTRLAVIAHFDNSANNAFNPDPHHDVRWGDQTWEEMMVPWVGVIIPANADPDRVASYPHELRRGRFP